MVKTENKNTMYKIDSCHEKIKCLTNDVCNKPSYHTVCYRPIVDRSLLTHSDYLKMLSTPRGFKWTDMPLYHKKRYNSYKFHKLENEKYNVYDQQKMNYGKACHLHKKTMNNQKQRKMNDTLNLNNYYYKSKKLRYRQRNITQNDETKSYNASKTKIKNININKYGVGDKLKHKNHSLIQEDEDSSSDKLRKIKDQREADDFMKEKKRLWLQTEKKRKKREEEEKKFKSSLEAKQKEKEEQKKNMEEKIKMKSKRKQILEKQRKQKIENEKEDITKAQGIAKQKILEENNALLKDAERQHRLEALKEKKEEAWRKKINEEFALKMGFTMNSNIVNKKNEHSVCNNGNKILTQCTDKLLKELKQNNQVFDPGNLMKQIIKRELNKAENKRVRPKSRLQLCKPCNEKIEKIIILEAEKKKEKPDLPKKIGFNEYCEFKNIINSKNSNRVNQLTEVKSNEHCVQNKPKKGLKCKIPNVHSYSYTSFSTLVCNWKNEVADMIANMQKRRYDFTK